MSAFSDGLTKGGRPTAVFVRVTVQSVGEIDMVCVRCPARHNTTRGPLARNVTSFAYRVVPCQRDCGGIFWALCNPTPSLQRGPVSGILWKCKSATTQTAFPTRNDRVCSRRELKTLHLERGRGGGNTQWVTLSQPSAEMRSTPLFEAHIEVVGVALKK